MKNIYIHITNDMGITILCVFHYCKINIYIYIYFWSFHLHENIISFIFKQFLHLFCNYYKARCCYNEYKKNGVILLSWKFLLLVLYSLFIRTIHIFVIFCNCQKKRGGGRKLYKLKKDAEDTLKIEQQLWSDANLVL